MFAQIHSCNFKLIPLENNTSNQSFAKITAPYMDTIFESNALQMSF